MAVISCVQVFACIDEQAPEIAKDSFVLRNVEVVLFFEGLLSLLVPRQILSLAANRVTPAQLLQIP